MNVLTPGFAKGSFDHLIVPMPPKLVLSERKLEKSISVWIIGNSITIQDAFPLSHIDEALQVVHNCNVFTSFDLAQGYLQLAMAEDDIKRLHLKPVFQACMTLLICLFACPMLGQASAG